MSYCRGQTLQMQFWELFNGEKNNHSYSTLSYNSSMIYYLFFCFLHFVLNWKILLHLSGIYIKLCSESAPNGAHTWKTISGRIDHSDFVINLLLIIISVRNVVQSLPATLTWGPTLMIDILVSQGIIYMMMMMFLMIISLLLAA